MVQGDIISRMAPNIPVSISKGKSMAKGLWYLLIILYMKVHGKMESKMGAEGLKIWIMTLSKVSGCEDI
jgi:hypothetical protein